MERSLPPLLRLAARQLGAGQHAAASSLAAGLAPGAEQQPPTTTSATRSASTSATAASAASATPRPSPAVIPATRLQGPYRRGDPRYYPPASAPSPASSPRSSPSSTTQPPPADGGYSELRRRWEAGAPLPKPNARRLRLRNQEAVRKRPAAAAGHAPWLPLPAEARAELRAALEASGLSPAAADTVASAAAGRPQGTRGPAPPADPAELARRVRHVAAAQRAAVAAAAQNGGDSSSSSASAAPTLPLAGLDLDWALRRRDRVGLGSGCGDQRGALLWLSPGRFDARVRYLDAQLAEAARPAREEANKAAATAAAATATSSSSSSSSSAADQQQRLAQGFDVGAVMTAAPGLAMRAPKELARRAAAWPTLLREGLASAATTTTTTTPTTATTTPTPPPPLLPPAALNNRHAGVLTRPVPRMRERAGALGARLGPDAAALALARAPALLSRRGRLVAQRMHEVKGLLLLPGSSPEQQKEELASLVARAPRVLLTQPETLAARLDAVAAAMSGGPDAGASVAAALAAARAATRRRWVGVEEEGAAANDEQLRQQQEEQEAFEEAGVPPSLAAWTGASIGWRTAEALELLEGRETRAAAAAAAASSSSSSSDAAVLSPSAALRAALAAVRSCPAALMSKSPPAVRAHVEALQGVLFPTAGSGEEAAAVSSSSSSSSSPSAVVAALLRAHPALLTRSANSVRNVAVTLSQHSLRSGSGSGDNNTNASATIRTSSLAALDAAGLRAAALAAPSLLALSTSCLDARLAAWEALAAGGARWAAALRDLRAGPEAVARALTAPQTRYARLAWLAEAAAREEPPQGGEGLESLVTWDDARFAREYPAWNGSGEGGGSAGGGGV